LNFGSDHQVRNAFRATLLDEPSSTAILGTQELDAADVLEVTDLANAIARAEEALRARSSRMLPDSSASHPDIFDKLLARDEDEKDAKVEQTAADTDDAVGPAVHVPYRPTPLPPRAAPIPLPPGITRPATLLRAPEPLYPTPIPVPSGDTPMPAIPPPAPSPARKAGLSANATQPLAAVSIPPAARTAPLLLIDEDAFYHPAGRIRTLAEATLDGYRPEPTLLVRLRERRQKLSWVVLAVLAPLLLLVLFVVAVGIGRASVPATPMEAAPVVEPAPQPAAPAVVEQPAATVAPVATSDVPVVDVNSLKSVAPAKPHP
jgi:hypothetical protein